MLVSIDPGVRTCGVALWEDGELAAAWLTKGENWADTARNVKRDVCEHLPLGLEPLDVAIEKPQIYHQSKQKGDQADLIELAVFVGAVATRCATGEVYTYLPRTWKSNVPKDIMVERIKARLSADEHSRITLPAPSLRHNVFDAVGLGLHHLRSKRRTTTSGRKERQHDANDQR